MKTVLITGGTRGIGKATAFVFASHGYQLALSYCTREDTAIKTKEEIEKEYGVNVMLVKADL